MNLGLVCERQEAHGQLIINSSWLIGMGQKKLSDLVLHSFTGSQFAIGEARPIPHCKKPYFLFVQSTIEFGPK